MGSTVTTQPRQQAQLQQLLAGLTAVRGGDFDTRLPEVNDPLVTRVAREVGTEGRLGGQAEVPGAGPRLP